MAEKHVFLSYLREDKDRVDELQASLEAAGFAVWRDTKELWAGDNWELKIRQAIQGGSIVFLACFSSSLAQRDKSYQFAELVIAADEYRVRPMDTNWLMTVRFDECEIPPVDLGMGRTLDQTINRIDLFGKQQSPQLARLIMSIQRVMDSSPGQPSSAVLAAIADARRDKGSIDRLRDLIRSPSLVMDFDEFMRDLRTPALSALGDRERFPMHGESGSITPDQALDWVARIRDYEVIVSDLIEPASLISMYGEQGHQDGLTRLMRALAAECSQREGLDFLRLAHQYPALVLTYVIVLSSLVKNRFEMIHAGVELATVTENNIPAPFVARAGVTSVEGNWRGVASLLVRADEGEDLSADLAGQLLQHTIPIRLAPVSDHIYSLLAPVYRDHYSSDDEYAEAFDRAEVIIDAIDADAHNSIENLWGGRRGYGRYTYRYRWSETPIEAQVRDELEAAGAGWTPLLGGMFGGDIDRAKAALEKVVDTAGYVRQSRRRT